MTSKSSATSAPAKVAIAIPTISLCERERQKEAASPVAAPPIARLLVYVTHLRCGGRVISLSSDAAPTSIAARGPNTTAAKSVGSIEIDWDVVLVRRTSPRSETAAITQRAATAHGSPKSQPAIARPAAMRIEAKARHPA